MTSLTRAGGRGGLIALALVAATARAQPAIDRSELFAREALRICVDTAAEPAAVRALAAAERWTSIDPASVPVKARVVRRGKKRRDDQTYVRSGAWTIEKDGLAATIGLFDVPGEPRIKQCELIASDLDSAIVDRALRADTRMSGNASGLEQLRMYTGPGVRVTYISSDTGSKILHVLTVN